MNNTCIVTRLTNVRPHPNADRLQLATVLGTQVIVGLDDKEGDLVLYFDSNLRLSHAYLHYNNLYSNSELNADTTKKGYFPSSGRVKCQKLRGELSNGFVAPLDSVAWTGHDCRFNVGDEFNTLTTFQICDKYVVPTKQVNVHSGKGKKKYTVVSDMFKTHWETPQLMRTTIDCPNNFFYIEEKIHGTSGRTGNVLCDTNRPWWKFWLPKQEWRVISGTRRCDHINGSFHTVRQEIHDKLAPHVLKGETLYYEIFGYDGGNEIQKGFTYGCRPGEYNCMLYRVTMTTPDGQTIDLDREYVYQRAETLGLEQPLLLSRKQYLIKQLKDEVDLACHGKSVLDANTLFEGVVVWYQTVAGRWTCVKHKSPEFLLLDSRNKDKGIGDVEDGS